MERPYEKIFDYWTHVCPEFEKHMVEDNLDNYGSSEFIPGSMRLYFCKDDISLWGRFAQEGDIPIHWHLAGLNKNSIETTFRNDCSLVRRGSILYSGMAKHGHAFVPISPDSLISESYRESEKILLNELNGGILESGLL